MLRHLILSILYYLLHWFFVHWCVWFYSLMCCFFLSRIVVLFALIPRSDVFSFHACIPNDLFSGNIESPKLATLLHVLPPSLSFCPWNMKTTPREYENLFYLWTSNHTLIFHFHFHYNFLEQEDISVNIAQESLGCFPMTVYYLSSSQIPHLFVPMQWLLVAKMQLLWKVTL